MMRLIVIAVLVIPDVVLAQPLIYDPTTATLGEAKVDGTTAPWAEGVSLEDREAARALFSEGNRLLNDAAFSRATKSYHQALRRWDHPAIHYHLALALINLDAPIDVDNELLKAIAYGPDPLAENQFSRALEYRKLVAGQIGAIEVTLIGRNDTDMVLTIDDEQVLHSLGRWTGRVRVGRHTVTAFRNGYLPPSRTVFVGPGETVHVELRLNAENGRACGSSPPHWPYVAIGVGTGLIIATAAFRRSLATGDGAIGYLGGALAVAAGGVPLLRGQPRPADCNPALDSNPDPPVAIAPMLGRDVAGVAAAVRF
jgi:hypothetical protein